jgi:hypothetical protein
MLQLQQLSILPAPSPDITTTTAPAAACKPCCHPALQDVADAIAQMHVKGRYRELLLIVETCQAATLYSKIQ